VMTSTAVIPGDYVADMTAGQEMQGEMSNGESRLYLGYYAGIDPVAPAAIGDLAATPGPEAGQMSLAWTAPGDDANVGTAMKYEIRYSTEPITVGNFASAALAADIPLPQPAGTAQTHVVSGLENGKTYYFAIMAMDELPNQSLSNTASAKTLEVAQSEAQIGGKPAVKVVSKTPDLNIAQVPAESQEAAALASRGAAPGQGLVFFSDIYEITPSMQLTEGATVQFGYEDLGTDVERELAVYKYNPALSQWVMLAGAVDADNNVITAVTYSFSLFAVFARDTKSPTTEIVFEEGSTYRDDFDDIYISSRTLLGFKAEDPTLGGKPGSGVKETGYRIDSSTTPFITFTAAFPPGEGFHGVQYRSVDNAGNAEQTKQSGIRVDASAPVIGFTVDKTTITLRDKMIVPAVSCALTVTVFDPSIKGAASGVRYASVAVNGENVPAGGAGFVKQLAGGAYHVAASAEDHLGNKAENEIDILVVPDALAPRSGLGIVGTAYRAGGIEYVTGKASFTLTSVDDLITPGDGAGGVKKQNVKIRDAENIKREESFENPKPEQGGIFSSTFSLAAWGLADGAYYLDYNAEDMLGNIETVRRSSVALDNLPPETATVFGGAAGADGWHVSPVETTLVSADALSGVKEIYYSLDVATYTLYTSHFTIAPEGGHSLKYYAADFLGNTETEKSGIVKIDLSSPTILASVAPAPNAYGWSSGPVGVMFTGSDTVSGLAFCSSSATVSGEGARRQVSGACFDNAGLSSTRAVSVSIDTTPPSILYAQSPPANEYSWNGGDVTLKFTCADNLSGIKSCPADIVLSAEGVNISTSARAFDYADNSKTVSISGINIDKTLPVSTAALSGTYKNGWYSSPVNITLTSTDSLSGIEKTGYSVEGPGYSN
ncbi:MAG: hypothetical protein KKH28_11175, partial [Elusimicrobia bacterium]|nr:hypothetical protein [Elusimicrobiota bacterium]